MKSRKIQTIVFAALLSLTLGLAPFVPEPHVIQKWRWLMDGAVGMELMDWFDLVMHSSPFAFLIYAVVDFLLFLKRNKQKTEAETEKLK